MSFARPSRPSSMSAWSSPDPRPPRRRRPSGSETIGSLRSWVEGAWAPSTSRSWKRTWRASRPASGSPSRSSTLTSWSGAAFSSDSCGKRRSARRSVTRTSFARWMWMPSKPEARPSTTWSWSTSRAGPSGHSAVSWERSPRRCCARLRSRPRRVSRRSTEQGSCTGTSSPKTCSSPMTTVSASWTSAWPGRSRRLWR
jgi:hypothetical protein